VIINEAVELAKGFGAEQSHKYINGVLDNIARRTRAAEIEASVN
jgi:N utilization substance protein B